ncbi:hypothetical protein B0H19DRAFT_1265190 [Mycena capillaripes]|nr:hypothetical protein B0H19DRAFT_1265190 [Mycena capillaripes]
MEDEARELAERGDDGVDRSGSDKQRNPSPLRFTVSHAQRLRRPSFVAKTALIGSSHTTSIRAHPQPHRAPLIAHAVQVASQRAANILSTIPLRRSKLRMPHTANHDALNQCCTQRPLRPSPPRTSPPSPTCAVRPFSAGFRLYMLNTAAALLSATCSATHSARHSRRCSFCVHARHDHRLRYPSLIHDAHASARSPGTADLPSSCGDRSALPKLPSPPPARHDFSQRRPIPASSAVALRAPRILR